MKKTLLSIILGLGLLSNAGAQTTIFSEDFQGGVLPVGWSQTTAATDGGWLIGDSAALASSSFPFPDHTLFAGTNDDACNCTKLNDLLKTPVLNFTGYSNVFMNFASLFIKGTYQAKTESAKVVVSTNGGTTWTDVATIGAAYNWVSTDVNLSAYAGQASVMVGFKYSDGGGWLYGWGVDDVNIFEPPVGVDLAVLDVTVGKLDARPSFAGFPKYITSYPLTVKTTVRNLATVPVTSFDFNWSNGTSNYSQSITGLNIAPLGSYTFDATTGFTTASGLTTITSTISNINNGATELNLLNNASDYTVEGVTINPNKKYFAEEGTGTWCQWCPRGAVYMEYMEATYPDQFVGVAVHNGDPMTITAYDASFSGLIGGYPSCISNRTNEIDPSELELDFINKISAAPDVILTGSSTLNLATNQITIDLSSLFTQNLSGDFRYMAVVVEDSVTGTGSTYNQSNSYGGGGNGPMGGFELLGTTVPAASMKYYFVNRDLLGTFDGVSGSIPATVTTGTPYTYQFTSTPVATWVKARLSVAAVVLNSSTGQVMNAAKFPINVVTGLNNNNVGSLKGSFIYPTLVTDNITLSLTLAKASNVTYTITDVLGKVIISNNLGSIQSGTSSSDFNVNSLNSGLYLMNVYSSEGNMTQKFVKQ